jgi:hypothetical protein
MPRVGFEPSFPVFERAKTVFTSEASATVFGGVDVQIHVFLTSALVGGECSTSRPGRFTPGERAPGTHLTGGWVDLRASLDELET